MKYPESLEQLIKSFEMYPGIGPKTAERLAFFTIDKMTKENAYTFSNSIINALENIKKCNICGALTEKDMCDVCSDSTREKTLMIVENSRDVISFEKIGIFNGKYHVLNGLISPLNGISPEDLNLDSLLDRIKKEEIKEVIISLASTINGEMTSLYIKKLLENEDVLVYRIGYGLPAGADIEYIDEITLSKALEGKRKI